MIYKKKCIHFINNSITLWLLLSLLSGCGFKPRGSDYESLAGQNVVLFSENPYGSIERSIKDTLSSYSVSVENAALLSTESLREYSAGDGIQVTNLQFKKHIISVDVFGRPAEYETTITVDVKFLIKNAQQQQQIQQQQFSVQRDYRYDKNNTLADDLELEKLTAEMYVELARRIISQFSTQSSGQIN